MPTFREFAIKAKMRPDFGDMIQVRYTHTDGDNYDTWISGKEVLQRLRSETAEEQFRNLRQLDWSAIEAARENLVDEGKKNLKRKLIDRLSDEVKGAIGSNITGDDDADEAEREKWRTHLQETPFRAKVLELAWIQLEGTFPDDDDIVEEPDDWM